MKKYGMIFASAIFTLLIMLVPYQKINAEESIYVHIDYDSEFVINLVNTASEKIDIAERLSDYYSSNYRSAIVIEKDCVNFLLFESVTSINIRPYFGGGYNNKIEGRDVNYKVYELMFDSSYDFDTLINAIDNSSFKTSSIHQYFHSSMYIYGNSIPSESFKLYEYSSNNYSSFSPGVIYSTNLDSINIIDSTKFLPITFDGINFLEEDDYFLSYTDFMATLKKNIDISSNFACDLNNKDMELVTIDFSDYDILGYSYQYGIKRKENIDTIVWFDIVNIGNYVYQFNEYYNETIIYARVLDSTGNEVAVSQYKIDNNELPKFELIISSALGCPIPNYDDDPQAEIITIDFRNVYSENYRYYYFYDSRTKYELNVTSNSLVQQIVEYLYQFIYFEIYDENDNLIYFYYNTINSDDRLGFIPDDYEERHRIKYNISPSCDLDGNETLNLQFDFSNITKYVNHYNFDVVINGEHFGAIQYYNLILDDSNYLENLNYEVKIYIDDYIYASGNYSVGSNSSSFDDIYNDTLNDLTSSDINDNESLFNLFINSLNHFRDVIVDIFNNCTYFFDNLDSTLKYFYVSIFSLIVFGFLIRFIL